MERLPWLPIYPCLHYSIPFWLRKCGQVNVPHILLPKYLSNYIIIPYMLYQPWLLSIFESISIHNNCDKRERAWIEM